MLVVIKGTEYTSVIHTPERPGFSKLTCYHINKTHKHKTLEESAKCYFENTPGYIQDDGKIVKINKTAFNYH